MDTIIAVELGIIAICQVFGIGITISVLRRHCRKMPKGRPAGEYNLEAWEEDG